MKLRQDGILYAKNLFGQRTREITRQREEKLKQVKALPRGGARDAAIANSYIDSIESQGNAYIESYVAAYAKSGDTLDQNDADELAAEVEALVKTWFSRIADTERGLVAHLLATGGRDATAISAMLRQRLVTKVLEEKLNAENGGTDSSEQAHTGGGLDRSLGIFNKDHFSDDLPSIFFRCQSKSEPMSVVVIDLDDFKHINDDYGHDVGDRTLKRVVEVMQAVTGAKGTCYRWGGDEFTIILPNYADAEAVPLAERILSQLASEEVEGLTEAISGSAGVAQAEPEALNGDQAFKDADDALRKAKASGKAKVGVAPRRVAAGVASGDDTRVGSITSRVQSVDVSVKLVYVDRGQYLIHLRNKSDKEEVTVLAIGLSTEDGIELISDVTPQQAGLWKLRPNQEMPISFRPDRDPAAQILALPHNLTHEERLVGRDPVTAKLAVIMHSKICGTQKDLRKLIVVRVAPDLHLTQVAG